MKEQISKEIFGTEDYESVLAVLSPGDALVREFEDRLKYLDVYDGLN